MRAFFTGDVPFDPDKVHYISITRFKVILTQI